MAEETLFSWVHLSDIHFGHGDTAHRWDQRMVLRELARDLDVARGEDLGIPKPDAILVTGDIAFSGNGVVRAPATESREYADARAWFIDLAGMLGLTQKDVFVVPGNHDVDRGKDRDRAIARLVRGLQSGDDKLDDALANAADRAALAERMAAYLKFAADFAPGCFDPAQSREQRLFWSHTRTAPRGLKVRLVGLNTALLSSGDADYGHLRLGNEQLQRSFDETPIARDGELVIALSHHPLRGWLADARDVETRIRRYAHLHLSGHVHEAESEDSRVGGASHGFVHVVAGASHGEAQAASEIPKGHGYNWAAIVADERGNLELRIWPRKWSDANHDFRQDVDRVPRGRRYAKHELDVKVGAAPAAPGGRPSSAEEVSHLVATAVPAAAPPVTPAPVPAETTVAPAATATPKPTGPVDFFTFYSPKDDELRDELETHLAGLRKKGVIKSNSLRSIDLGEAQAAAIDAHIESARVFLVLVSPSFINSDFIDGPALERALERWKKKEALVIPIYLKPCDWQTTTKLGSIGLQGLPRDGVPVSKRDHDDALAEIAKEIRHLVEALQKR